MALEDLAVGLIYAGLYAALGVAIVASWVRPRAEGG